MKQKKIISFLLLSIIAFIYPLCYNDIIMYSDASTSNINSETFDIYTYIKNIDSILLHTPSINKQCSFSEEQMLDICIQYIIQNQNIYKEKITYETDLKEYVEDDSIYYVLGYISNKTLSEVLIDIFGVENINILEYELYDAKKDCFLLIPKIDEYATFEDSKLLSLNKNKENDYVATVEYNRTMINTSNLFKVDYTLYKKDDKFYLKHMLIYDSTLIKGD